MLLALALFAAACGDNANDASAGAQPACGVGDLNLVEPERLTIATGDPVFPPWIFDQDPTGGRGFESAVAYALAGELGLDAEDVNWVRVSADEAATAGATNFDFAIEQYRITEELAEVVAFSDPYYTVRYALVAQDGSPVEAAATTEDLLGMRLGTAIDAGTLNYIDRIIQPAERAEFFETNGAAKAALEAGQVDALVYDVPTSYVVTALEMPDASIVAQLAQPDDPAEQFGLVFATSNSLLDCVNLAMASLTASGVLADLEQEWLAEGGRIRTIAPEVSPGTSDGSGE